jgi:hypothetical protein
MWVWSRDLSINIGDAILSADAPAFKAQLGFDMKQNAVLHELVHAYDNGVFSYSDEFLDLVGWVRLGQGFVLKGVDPTEMIAFIEQMKTLQEEKNFQKLLAINRKFGIKHGFPSGYAMNNPQECFAEIAAYVFYDPHVRDYMNPEWIEWFQRTVLN